MNTNLIVLLLGGTGLLSGLLICAIILVVQMNRLKSVGKELIDLMDLAHRQHGKQADRLQSLELIAKAQKHQYDNALEELGTLNSKVGDVRNEAQNYGKLLIHVRDFYAALRHFGDGIDRSSQVSLDLANTLATFDGAVGRAHRAAADFNQVLALVQRRQDEISERMDRMARILEEQSSALKKLVGETQITLKSEMALESQNALKEVVQALEKQSEVSERIAEGISRSLKDPQGGILAKLFGGK